MNVLSQGLKNSICVLAKAGYSFREIARRLHLRRDTVSKYAKAAGIIPGRGRYSKPAIEEKGPTGSVVKTSHCNNIPPPGEKASKSKSACEVHREWIEAQVESGRNGVAIYQDLVEKFGFTHKYDSVKAFVRRIKKKAPKRFDRLEFPPGEEAQVDYGQGAPYRHPKSGKYRKPRLFVMTLKYSRRSFRKVVWKSSQEAWAQLHEEAFRYFGGCPQYVVLDNLKEGVIKPDIYEPELNPVYSSLLKHYGVVADPARVGDADRKGTVESSVKHT